jgi:hypothetical protein
MNVGWHWRKRKEFKLMLKCKHQYHCACCLEIRICIINDTRRWTAHKKTPKIHIFWSNLSKQHFILMFWRYILTFNSKFFWKNQQNNDIIPLKIILLAKKFYSNIKAKIMSYGINSSQIICKQWFDSA